MSVTRYPPKVLNLCGDKTGTGAGIKKVTKTIEIPMQGFEEFFY
jgi:hypothetical protein